MTEHYLPLNEEVRNHYNDMGACLLALMNALQKKGVLTNAEMRDAAQERLLSLTVDGRLAMPFDTLRLMATALPLNPDE